MVALTDKPKTGDGAMIHADDELIEVWAQECRRRHPGVRIENWRTYVRAVIGAVNGVESSHEPLRAAFNDGPETVIVQTVLQTLGDQSIPPETD